MSEQEWLEQFSEKLKDLLDLESMTQKELAQETDLSVGAINSYINGCKIPGVKALLRIANVFGISVDELVNFGDVIY